MIVIGVLIQFTKGIGPSRSPIRAMMYMQVFLHDIPFSSCLDAYNYRNDNGSFHCSLQEELRDRIRQVFSCGVEVGCTRIAERCFHGFPYDEARLVHELFVVAQIDESARDDV